MAPRPLDAALKNAKRSGIARISVLLAILVFCFSGKGAALDPTSHISQYGHSVWRVQDGYFGGATPSSITQTTDGYIWLGTAAGLYRFDGVRFLRWSPQSGPELPSSLIVHLLGARDGSLWIGTDSGLARLVNNQLILYQKTEWWVITDIIEDQAGKVWFTRIRAGDYTHSLCQVVDAGVRCYGREDGVEANGVLLAQDRSGDLWVGGSASLFRWRPGTSTVYRPRSLPSNSSSSGGFGALAPAVDGSLWVGMLRGRGAALQHIVAGTLKAFLAQKLNRETLEVLALRIDQQNGLWVGTTHGLYRIHGTDIDHYGSADGLSGEYVPQIFEDREANVWVATSQGLDMFRNLPVKSFSKHEGLNEDAVESVAASQDGSVWIAPNRLQVLGSQGLFFGPGQAVPGNRGTSLFVDHAGRLWAGMNDKLFVHERAGFRQITKQDGSALGTVMGITEDLEHTIWVESGGPPPGALLRIRELKVTQEFLAPEIPLARKIVADPQSGIWLGLLTGDLARYRDGQLNTFTFRDHPDSRVLAITATPDGSILGGTAFGVVGWKNGKQQILTVRNGLRCNYVTAVISDDAGNLWLDSLCGLVEIPNDQMKLWWEHSDSKLSLRVFDTVDGVRPGLGRFNTSAKTPDGRLWFANGSVLQAIDPAHMPQNTLPPPIDVSALIADHKAYPLGSSIRLPALTRDLEIDYTALSYVAPQRVLFRYMLEGYDAGWQNPGTRRQAFYNDLRPNHYRFRVIACNNDGVWNETGASVDFSILPAYYQTAWFRFACAAAFLLLLWAAYRLHVQQLKQKFAIGVQARVNERTRIARDLHDTLLQSFQGLMLRLQVVEDLLPEGKAKDQLEQTMQRADQAIAEGRRAVYDLRSSSAVPTDLAQAVRSLADEFATENSAAFHLVVEGEARDLNPMIRDELYFITREALRNAFSHARAHDIEAEITYGERSFRLRIRDDGEGIPPQILEEGRPGHYGLSGMRERAKQIGGKLDFWSRAGAGTEIDLSIPGSIAYRASVTRPLFSFVRKRAG